LWIFIGTENKKEEIWFNLAAPTAYSELIGNHMFYSIVSETLLRQRSWPMRALFRCRGRENNKIIR
jgi:hypothetical protein